MPNSAIIYGLLDINNCEMILDSEWLDEYFEGVEIFFHNSERPLYGVICELDEETATIKVSENNKQIVDTFFKIYKKLYELF